MAERLISLRLPPGYRSMLRLGCVCALLAACSGENSSRNGPPAGDEAPMLLLGVDGLEWDVLLPLLDDGRMPHVAGLMQRGSYGILETMVPTKSPRLWTTIATGKLPEQHGILGFTKPSESPDEPRLLYTSADRQTKAYWNILGDYGVSTDTIGWWMTFPAEPVLGLMVSQTNTLEGRVMWKGELRADLPDQVWPAAQEAQVLATLAEADENAESFLREIFGEFAVPLTGNLAERWAECEWSFRADSVYAAIARSRTTGGPRSRVTTVYVGGTDVVGHRFWSAYDPAPFDLEGDSDEVRQFGHVIPTYYEYVDRFLGELLESFPADTTVVLVSDHGMGPFIPKDDSPVTQRRIANGTTGGHEDGDPGVFIAAGRGIVEMPRTRAAKLERSALATVGRIDDVCPTILALLGVPYGEDMEGRPMLATLDAEFLKEHAIASVPTHDDPDWFAARKNPIGVREDERIQQLKNLGYLGDEGEER